MPECAMVPRFSTNSPWVMPRPVSVMVIVPALSSVVTAMPGATSGCWIAWPDDWLKRSFSHASAALEISSRMKISLSV